VSAPAEKIKSLQNTFASHLASAEKLKRAEGIPTETSSLNQYLFWGGIPKGSISLFKGEIGSGATSLWLEAATRVIRSGRWAAWVNSDVPLCPLPLYHRGVDLQRFVSVDASSRDSESLCLQKKLYSVQELISSSLFDLIGCDLGNQRLKEHQLKKLQTHARQANVALVFITQTSRSSDGISIAPNGKNHRTWQNDPNSSFYSLIIQFEPKQFVIERAQHRPVPHRLSRSLAYDRFTRHTTAFIGEESLTALNSDSTASSLLKDRKEFHR
jgi:recombination protein RecA